MRMSVDERTVSAWERDREPFVTHYPGIIEFLDCEPWSEPKTVPERLLAARRRRGLTIDAAATDLGVEPSTVWWWEAGRKPHRLADRARLEEFMGGPVAALPGAVSDSRDGDCVPSIGRLLRERRAALGLTQKQAATELHVNEFTLMNWELDRHTPGDRYYPTLIAYLGREPWPEPTALSDRLRTQRLRQGFTIAQLATVLAVDESSLAAWERGQTPSHASSREKVSAFVERMPLPRRRQKPR
jgi:transcriptional regulator with XRE-family HTH domain